MKKLSILITAFLFISTAMAGTLKITQNSSNANTHKLWKEKVIPMFEKENPGINVEMTIYDHEAYKTAIRNFLQAEPPDVVNWFSGNRMKFFVDQGLFEDVSDVWKNNCGGLDVINLPKSPHNEHPKYSTKSCGYFVGP